MLVLEGKRDKEDARPELVRPPNGAESEIPLLESRTAHALIFPGPIYIYPAELSSPPAALIACERHPPLILSAARR